MTDSRAHPSPMDHRRLVFDSLPHAVVVMDLSGPLATLTQLQSSGIGDLLIHLQLHPGTRSALLAQIRIVDANQAALAAVGVTWLEEWRADPSRAGRQPALAMLDYALVAAWERRLQGERTESFRNAAGQRCECLLQHSVPANNGARDWSRVVVTMVDVGRTRRDIASQTEERELQAEIFARANVLVWRARVRREQGNFIWKFQLPSNSLATRLFHLLQSPEKGDLWDPAHAPDSAAMEQRSRQAMISGASGYQQEFRVVANGKTAWLSEDVTIQALGPDDWSLVGVVSDVTARHEAEAAHRRSLAHVKQLLERADCMFWQAHVRLVDGDYRWEFDLPASGLQCRLFRDPEPIDRQDVSIRNYASIYGGYPVLEQAGMNERSEHAFRAGLPGYQQEFRVQAPDQVFWLQEQVSINVVAPDEWDLVGVVFDVTARHEAEDARRRSEAQVRQILEGSECMLWLARVQQTAAGWDWSFEVPASRLRHRLWGDDDHSSQTVTVRAPELYGVGEIPERPEMDVRGHAALLAGAASYQNEFRVLKPGGTVWLQEQVAVTQVAPQVWQLIGVVLDSTARRQAEAARVATEERLKQLLTRADCLLWEARVTENADGTFHWSFYIPTSVLFRELFGADPEHCPPGMWGNVHVPEFLELQRRSSAAFRSGAPGYTQEFRVVGDARTYWLREKVSIVPAGPGAWDVVGVVTDITARREAEAALAAEKERLAVTLRAMSEGVLTTDIQGRVLFLNRAASELLGRPVDAAVGQPIVELCRFSDARSGAAASFPLEQVLRDGAMFDLPPHTVLAKAGGGSCLVAGRCAPVRDAASNIIGAVLVLGDITERQRLDEQLQRASKLESVGILAGGIAHDFNNILTAIMGNLSLTLLQLPEHSPLHESLIDAHAAALRARDLTHQLLTFAKGGDPVRGVVHLPDVITEVSRFALHGSSVRSEYDLPANLWMANADKGQVGQIVQNLVINAVQAMASGGVLRITARNEPTPLGSSLPLPPGDYVHVTVSDTGTGIAADQLGRIFDPYFTTKQFGHGLGLATVYSIVRRHGGHIDVESQVGRGTTFHIWLPALRSQAGADHADADASQGAALHGRVLFMDDEAPIRKLGEALLRRLGLDVEVAADGEEVVRRFQAARAAGRPFDAVVMDLTVPGGMGGREAFEALRKIDPRVCAIVSSGYSSDPVLANYRALGFAGVVAKPYEVAAFARVLREALSGVPAVEK